MTTSADESGIADPMEGRVVQDPAAEMAEDQDLKEEENKQRSGSGDAEADQPWT